MDRDYKPGDEPVPRFVLRRKLGKGAFGEVWMAASRGGVNVALKIISLENKSGLKEFRAIRTVKNVHHPNLVPIIDIWLRDSNGDIIDEGGEVDSVNLRDRAAELIIAMGLGEKSLLDRLKECQKQGRTGIPADELIHYMENAARAIDYLNFPQSDSERSPIQHCDIKPGNIMIVGGSAQVCDFGLARVLGTDARATRSGDHMSVPYTSPELFWDASKPSQWSDQYSLAVTYVELRTGSLPFEHLTPAGMMFAHTQGKLDLSKLTPREQTIIRRATSIDAGKRFPTTMDLVLELRRANERTSRVTTSTGPWAQDSLQTGAEIVPGYRLVRRIGQGGYGTVWEARAPGGRPVALKVICNLEAGTGRQEFKALELIKSLNHLHLLELHAYWLLDGDGGVIPDEVWNEPDAPNADTLVIATKLAQMNLQQRLHECQQEGAAGIPSNELIGYMRQTALAIDYLNEPKHPQDGHLVSIQHRDIKPENILLVGGGTVQVGDFGLARVLEGTSSSVRRESRAFTPPYAAPELYTDKVTRWTDQYALALSYYKLRTGVLPFSDSLGRTEIMMAHVEGKLDLSRLHETEREVIARAVSKESERRFPTCLAMVDALDRALRADFPIAEREPLLRPQVDRDHHVTTPYPNVISDAPHTVSVGTSAAPVTQKVKDIYYTDPAEHSISVTNTPPTQGNPTDKSPKVRPSQAPSSPSVKPGWKPAVGSEPKSRGSALKYAMGAMLFLAVAAAGYFAVPHLETLLSGGGGTPETSQVVVNPPPTKPIPITPTLAELTAEIDSNLSEAEAVLALKHETGAAKNVTAETLAGAVAALAKAEGLSKEHELKEKWNRIIFGKARCLGRQQEWKKSQEALRQLEKPASEAEKLHGDFLVRIVEMYVDKTKPPDEKDLTLLSRLNGPEKSLDPWEDQQHHSLREQVDNHVWQKITAIFQKGPDADRASLETAFDTAKKLAEVIKTREPDVKREQDNVIESLWTAAKGVRSRNGNPFEPYDDPQATAHAKRWLELIESLSTTMKKSFTPEQRHELALALWRGTVVKDRVREHTEQLLKDYARSDNVECVPYLLTKAQSQPDELDGWKASFYLYEAIYQLLENNNKVHVQDRYTKALKLALQFGTLAEKPPNVDDAFKIKLGKAFYAAAMFFDKYPNTTVDDSKLARMANAEEAVKRWPEPEVLMRLCRWHQDAASAPRVSLADKRMYLEEAAKGAGRAATGMVAADDRFTVGSTFFSRSLWVAFYKKQKAATFREGGLLYEEIAKVLGEKEKYEVAIEEYKKAGKVDSENGNYLVDSGRCRFHLSQTESREKQRKEALAEAKTDLQAAEKKLPKDEKSEALYWLAMVYRKQETPDHEEAKNCLVGALENFDLKDESRQRLCADALSALLTMGESLGGACAKWTPNHEIESVIDHKQLATAADCFHQFAKFIDAASINEYSLIRTEKYNFHNFRKNDVLKHANMRLQQLAMGYWIDDSKLNFDKVLEILNLGIPTDLSTATYVNSFCLNRRNVLYAHKFDRVDVQPSKIDQKLLDEAEAGVRIAQKGFESKAFGADFPGTARGAAARLYLKKGDKKKAREHIDEGLKLPGLSEKLRNSLVEGEKQISPAR